MKATAKRLDLLDALKALAPLIGSAGKHHQLQNVCMAYGGRCDGEGIEISATNGRQAVSFEIEAQEAADGDPVLVDHGRLMGFLKADWGDEVRLEVTGGRLVVKGHTKASFAVEGTQNWPSPPVGPADGWGAVGGQVIEEMRRALPFVGGKDIDLALSKLLWVGEGYVWGGIASAIWMRRIEATSAFALDGEAARLFLGLAEGETGIEVAKGSHHLFFRGSCWEMGGVRAEAGSVDPEVWLAGLPEPESWVELPAMVNLIPTLEAVASVMGERSELRIDPDGTGGAKVSAWSDLVGGEGRIPCPFPRWATRNPEKALAILRELQRVAGTEKTVRVGEFGGGYLRFEVEGEATALLAGTKV